MVNQQVSNYILDNISIDNIKKPRNVTKEDIKKIIVNIDKANTELEKIICVSKHTIKRLRHSILENSKDLIPTGFVKVDDNYLVDSNGNILNAKRFRIVKVSLNHKGYLKFDRSGPGSKTVHRIVAEAFIPNPDNKPQVNHKDGNKLNNNVDNLEWVTNTENIMHAVENNLFKTEKTKNKANGSKNSMNILTESNVVAIRELYSLNVSKEELCEMYNVSMQTIGDIVTRRTWQHI